jgi:hypothetical protein
MSKIPNDEYVENLETMLDLARQEIEEIKLEMHGGRAEKVRTLIDQHLAVLDDPYFAQRAFRITEIIPPDDEYPLGQKLSWKNMKHRDRSGYKGWIPIEWDDKYGKQVQKWIPDPPAKWQGPDKMDNIVRRGDSILCRLDMKYWNARQLRRELLAARDRGMLEEGQDVEIRRGVKLTGAGPQRETGVDPFKKHDDPIQVEGIDSHRQHYTREEIDTEVPEGTMQE